MFKQVLHAVRVLDLAPGWSAYAGRLLGDLGAEVIKIEPPSGDPLRGTADFERLNANKYGCTLDVSTTEEMERLKSLAGTSDVLLAPEGTINLDFTTLKPSLIVVVVAADACVEQSIAAAAGVGVALWDRRRTGEGSRIDVQPLLTKPRALTSAQAVREPVSAHAGETQMESSPWHLSESATHIRLPAPALGEHNEYVFRDLLGG